MHRIPLPLPNDGLRAVNVYALISDDGLVLVDAGWALAESAALLDTSLATLDASVLDIRRLLVTHVHRDHYTQAVTVRRQSGASVSLGRGERPSWELLQRADYSPGTVNQERLRAYGAPELADSLEGSLGAESIDRDDWEAPDEWLEEGPLRLSDGRELEVVETPGHTVGHVVFHDLQAQLLFAGDHVLPTITPSIGFEPALSPDPLRNFLRSLAAVRARPDAALLPAHGEPAPSVHARVDELIAHHGRRLDLVEAVVARGASTPFGIAEQLVWTRREHRLRDLDPFNAMLAVFETAAHLDLLVAQGRVACEEPSRVPHFRSC